jgi:hypothetical protein
MISGLLLAMLLAVPALGQGGNENAVVERLLYGR